MSSRNALLIHLEPEYRDALHLALQERGYQVASIWLPEQACPADSMETSVSLDSRHILEWVRSNVDQIDCVISSCSLPLELPPAQRINYPPYDLYEYLLSRMHEQGYGRFVNLFYGPGSSRGLSLHQLQTIENRYDNLFANSDMLFNSVNIGPVEHISEQESDQIFRQRLETIVWLATTDDATPHKQFFRGYQGP